MSASDEEKKSSSAVDSKIAVDSSSAIEVADESVDCTEEKGDYLSATVPLSFSRELLDPGQMPHHEMDTFHVDETAVIDACSETGWSNCDARTFEVRVGPHYVSGQKAPSKKALYEVFAIDGLYTPLKVKAIHKFTKLDKFIEEYKIRLPEDKDPDGAIALMLQHLLPPVIVINFMVPNYEPEMTTSRENGEGWSIIFYARMSDELKQELEKWALRYLTSKKSATATSSATASATASETVSATASKRVTSVIYECARGNAHFGRLAPAIRLLSDFIHAEDGTELKQRFKCIARLMNPATSKLSFLVRQLVGTYNAKPFVARTSSTFYYDMKRVFAVDIDIHKFGYPARRGLSHMRGSVHNLIYDFGFVIEGNTDDELPECILLCARISKIGQERAGTLPTEFLRHAYKRKPKMLEEALRKAELEDTKRRTGRFVQSEPVLTGSGKKPPTPKDKGRGMWGWLG